MKVTTLVYFQATGKHTESTIDDNLIAILYKEYREQLPSLAHSQLIIVTILWLTKVNQNGLEFSISADADQKFYLPKVLFSISRRIIFGLFIES